MVVFAVPVNVGVELVGAGLASQSESLMPVVIPTSVHVIVGAGIVPAGVKELFAVVVDMAVPRVSATVPLAASATIYLPA